MAPKMMMMMMWLGLWLGLWLPLAAGGSCREAQLCCNGRDSSCVVQKAPINAIIEDLSDKPCYCDHACLKLGDCCDDFKDHCGVNNQSRIMNMKDGNTVQKMRLTSRGKREYRGRGQLSDEQLDQHFLQQVDFIKELIKNHKVAKDLTLCPKWMGILLRTTKEEKYARNCLLTLMLRQLKGGGMSYPFTDLKNCNRDVCCVLRDYENRKKRKESEARERANASKGTSPLELRVPEPSSASLEQVKSWESKIKSKDYDRPWRDVLARWRPVNARPLSSKSVRAPTPYDLIEVQEEPVQEEGKRKEKTEVVELYMKKNYKQRESELDGEQRELLKLNCGPSRKVSGVQQKVLQKGSQSPTCVPDRAERDLMERERKLRDIERRKEQEQREREKREQQRKQQKAREDKRRMLQEQLLERERLQKEQDYKELLFKVHQRREEERIRRESRKCEQRILAQKQRKVSEPQIRNHTGVELIEQEKNRIQQPKGEKCEVKIINEKKQLKPDDPEKVKESRKKNMQLKNDGPESIQEANNNKEVEKGHQQVYLTEKIESSALIKELQKYKEQVKEKQEGKQEEGAEKPVDEDKQERYRLKALTRKQKLKELDETERLLVKQLKMAEKEARLLKEKERDARKYSETKGKEETQKEKIGRLEIKEKEQRNNDKLRRINQQLLIMERKQRESEDRDLKVGEKQRKREERDEEKLRLIEQELDVIDIENRDEVKRQRAENFNNKGTKKIEEHANQALTKKTEERERRKREREREKKILQKTEQQQMINEREEQLQKIEQQQEGNRAQIQQKLHDENQKINESFSRQQSDIAIKKKVEPKKESKTVCIEFPRSKSEPAFKVTVSDYDTEIGIEFGNIVGECDEAREAVRKEQRMNDKICFRLHVEKQRNRLQLTEDMIRKIAKEKKELEKEIQMRCELLEWIKVPENQIQEQPRLKAGDDDKSAPTSVPELMKYAWRGQIGSDSVVQCDIHKDVDKSSDPDLRFQFKLHLNQEQQKETQLQSHSSDEYFKVAPMPSKRQRWVRFMEPKSEGDIELRSSSTKQLTEKSSSEVVQGSYVKRRKPRKQQKKLAHKQQEKVNPVEGESEMESQPLSDPITEKSLFSNDLAHRRDAELHHQQEEAKDELKEDQPISSSTVKNMRNSQLRQQQQNKSKEEPPLPFSEPIKNRISLLLQRDEKKQDKPKEEQLRPSSELVHRRVSQLRQRQSEISDKSKLKPTLPTSDPITKRISRLCQQDENKQDKPKEEKFQPIVPINIRVSQLRQWHLEQQDKPIEEQPQPASDPINTRVSQLRQRHEEQQDKPKQPQAYHEKIKPDQLPLMSKTTINSQVSKQTLASKRSLGAYKPEHQDKPMEKQHDNQMHQYLERDKNSKTAMECRAYKCPFEVNQQLKPEASKNSETTKLSKYQLPESSIDKRCSQHQEPESLPVAKFNWTSGRSGDPEFNRRWEFIKMKRKCYRRDLRSWGERIRYLSFKKDVMDLFKQLLSDNTSVLDSSEQMHEQLRLAIKLMSLKMRKIQKKLRGRVQRKGLKRYPLLLKQINDKNKLKHSMRSNASSHRKVNQHVEGIKLQTQLKQLSMNLKTHLTDDFSLFCSWSRSDSQHKLSIRRELATRCFSLLNNIFQENINCHKTWLDTLQTIERLYYQQLCEPDTDQVSAPKTNGP